MRCCRSYRYGNIQSQTTTDQSKQRLTACFYAQVLPRKYHSSLDLVKTLALKSPGFQHASPATHRHSRSSPHTTTTDSQHSNPEKHLHSCALTRASMPGLQGPSPATFRYYCSLPRASMLGLQGSSPETLQCNLLNGNGEAAGGLLRWLLRGRRQVWLWW